MTVKRAFPVLSLLVLSALPPDIARAQTPAGPPRFNATSVASVQLCTSGPK